MANSSFYGGRRGASFILVKSFLSVNDMITAFSQGDGYKLVNYDEYVVIDTTNKNNVDNGKIYRRGYDYQDEMGGAIYIGQFVGPAGYAPQTVMTTIDEVDDMVEQEGYSYRRSSGEYAPTDNLIPGKYVENNVTKYNDSIQYAMCSVRAADASETVAYVGFKFPYSVIEFSAQSSNAYQNPSVTREDNGAHPFYEKWRLGIPSGKKGDSVSNLTEEVATNAIENYTDRAKDIQNNEKVIVYNQTNFDNSAQGETKKYFLGKISQIEDIVISSSFHLLVLFSDWQTREQIVADHKNATYNNRNDWYDLGYIGNGTGAGAVVGAASDAAVQAVANQMPPYSAWFITEEETNPVVGE